MLQFRQKKPLDNPAEPLKALYPALRMRRMRSSSAIRDLVQERHLSVNDLILPLFVEEDISERAPIETLPGIFRESEKTLADAMKQAAGSGLKAVMLFGVSHHKDPEGQESLKSGGLLGRMIRRAKDAAPETLVIADLCFCGYTDHGHCGPLDRRGDVDNDRTLENLGRQAVIAAQAGADIVAPSGMMDGMVDAIRRALDENGHSDTAILSYAAKFASAFYGPFRDAAGCALEQSDTGPQDRATYQVNPANADEALREVALDIAEGADMVMVKPGLPYLDIIRQVKDRFCYPTFAYHVSGEYAMLRAAAEKGWLDYDKTLVESMLAFRRAGCDGILTYAAPDIARILEKNS